MKKLLLVLAGIGLLTLSGCSQVETGQVGVKTSFGKISGDPLSPGFYFINPFGTTIHKLNTQILTVNEASEAASTDLQTVSTEITLNYNLSTLNPNSFYTRLGDNQIAIENSIVKPAIKESFKAVVAQYSAHELITKRAEVSNKIQDLLASKLKQYDLSIDSISVTNFNFSEAYNTSIEANVKAEQDTLTAQNLLAKAKIEAQTKVVEAQADADAMNLRKSSITPDIVAIKFIEKWNGVMPSTELGNNPMMQLMVGK